MLKIEYIPVSSLKVHPDNPRIIKDDKFFKLCESLQQSPIYFEARPILYSNRTGENIIIAGNMRFRAAKHLKLKGVPAILMPNLSEKEELEIMIKDNIALGDWDLDILANQFDGDDLIKWGYEIDIKLEDVPDIAKEEPEYQKCPTCSQKLKKK